MEICIVVSVHFWYCFIYWADTSLLSYFCIHIWQSQRSVTGRIVVVYTSQDLINTVWRLPVILDHGRSFWICSKLSAPPIFMLSLPINKNVRQSCTLFLHFYPVWLWKHQKAFKTCIHLLLPSSAEPGSWKCSKTSLKPILLILLFPITKTCRALVWDLLAILLRDWSYRGRNTVLSPNVTEV